jgi:hypothetical protein
VTATRVSVSSVASGGRPGDALVAQLAALRARARRALAIRYCSVVAAPALIAGQALSFATGANGTQTLTIIIVTLVGALAGSVLAAVQRTPTLADTAALIDRTQRLESRAATGLQFADQNDVVSLLVLRDATARLAACDPALVFPVELPRRWPWMLASAAVISVLLAVAVERRESRRPAGSLGDAISAGGAPARSPAGASQVASASSSSTPRVEPAAPTTSARQDSKPPVDANAPIANRSTSASAPRAAGDTGSAPPPDRQPSSTRLGDPAPADVAAASIRPGEEPARQASRGASSSGAAGSTAGGAGGAGTGTARNEGKGAGGIKGGTLTSSLGDPAPADAAVPMTPTSPRYRTDWAKGQAAIARERVPPALRKYVRDYFAAIRPRQP